MISSHRLRSISHQARSSVANPSKSSAQFRVHPWLKLFQNQRPPRATKPRMASVVPRSKARINGIVAVPIMIVMMFMCHNKKVMGQFVNVSKTLRAIGWLATLIMLLATFGLFVTWKS
jgi:hypothetical protein